MAVKEPRSNIGRIYLSLMVNTEVTKSIFVMGKFVHIVEILSGSISNVSFPLELALNLPSIHPSLSPSRSYPSHFHSLAPSLTLSLSISLLYTPSLSLPLAHIPLTFILSLLHSLYLSQSPFYTHPLSLSLPLSLTISLLLSFSRSFTYYLSPFLS